MLLVHSVVLINCTLAGDEDGVTEGDTGLVLRMVSRPRVVSWTVELAGRLRDVVIWWSLIQVGSLEVGVEGLISTGRPSAYFCASSMK
jgi:hypothetical protein